VVDGPVVTDGAGAAGTHGGSGAGRADQSQRDTVDSLVEHLSGYRLLLVLDNCEHLAGAVAQLAGVLLRAVPSLRVLATSRHWLGAPGEQVHEVPPLAVRDDGDSEAMELLVDRAAAHDVVVDDRGAAARLCRLVDGIPLAIVLAAARLRTMPVADIAAQLDDDQFHLLANDGSVTVPSHQQTLRGVVNWSYELCSGPEQLLWQRLTVFSGASTSTPSRLSAATTASTPADALDLIAGLVRQSVLDRAQRAGPHPLTGCWRRCASTAGTPRRGSRRAASRQRGALSRAVRAGRAGLAQPARDRLARPAQPGVPNLRVAMDFCLARDDRGHVGLRTAVALARARSWFYIGTLGEGRWCAAEHVVAAAWPTPGHGDPGPVVRRVAQPLRRRS